MAERQSALAPYFSNLEQQHEANMLGMWVFLGTEVMFLGSIFLAYAVYHFAYPEAFAAASRELNLTLSTINTFILLCSSLTMALAVHAAQTDKRKGLVTFLLLTLVLASVFLGIKGLEYAEEFRHNLFPGPNFVFDGPPEAELFFGLYFAITGLHAIHMIIGMAVLVYFVIRAWQNHYSSDNYDSVEMMGLYWHFVDIVWVFIFPLYYLIDRAG
jgi:cytochrome c oxidase subunit 3